METTPRVPFPQAAARLPGALLIAACPALLFTLRVPRLGISDWIYVGLLVLHAGLGITLLLRARGSKTPPLPCPANPFLLFKASELMLAVLVVFFLFVYIFATNANMDYVQRFIASGGLRLAPNSRAERLAAAERFVPLFIVDLFWLVYPRIRLRSVIGEVMARNDRDARMAHIHAWALPLILFSGFLFAMAFPSFLSTDGLFPLAYICLIPLFLVLYAAPTGWGIFYCSVFGVFQAMITNYWLGTFNLVSLQFATVVTLLEYIPFLAVSLPIFRRAGRLDFLVFPAAWTIFDYLRSLGFLGYPWGMLGTSQFPFILLIQVASLTGVWGVTFLVTLFNSATAAALLGLIRRGKVRKAPLIVALASFAAALGWGAIRMAGVDAAAGHGRTVRLALIQQNGDPRKDDYNSDFNVLRRLTDQTLSLKPDLIVWSETAFVPNIRRWSAEDPAKEPLAALVRDFLSYQKTLGTWLVTGNDDYSIIQTPQGQERLEYNAAILFSPSGDRTGTYRKIHLVPFTESFPFKKQLPGVYSLLMNFDVHLWEPGSGRLVFDIPGLSFSTPICFEDVFPTDVREFVLSGAEAIVNLSNDYWSLTDAEAMQHAVNGLFRAVENGKPLARASASGLTCLVDPLGRITARAPLYESAALVVDMRVSDLGATLYTRWGDWFPLTLSVFLVLFAALIAFNAVRKRAP
jgi:apolipoprotein N-acyltransferase